MDIKRVSSWMKMILFISALIMMVPLHAIWNKEAWIQNICRRLKKGLTVAKQQYIV